jgi:hypothetical protein
MKLSVTEYALLRGISRQAVLKQIKHKRKLPLIKKVSKIGNNYVLDYVEPLNQSV